MSRLLGNPNMGAKVIIGEYRSDIETDREIEKRLPSIFMDINVITTIEGKKLVPIQELLKVEEQVHREQKETYKTAYKKGFDEGQYPDFPKEVSDSEKIEMLHKIADEMIDFFRKSRLKCEGENDEYQISRIERKFCALQERTWRLSCLEAREP